MSPSGVQRGSADNLEALRDIKTTPVPHIKYIYFLQCWDEKHQFLQVHVYFHISVVTDLRFLFLLVFLCLKKKKKERNTVLEVLDIIGDNYGVMWPNETVRVELDYNTNGDEIWSQRAHITF